MKANTSIFRTSILLFILLLSSGAFSQKQLLNIEDVQKRQYYPKSIYSTQFIGNTDNFSYTKDGKTLIIENGKKNQTINIDIEEITPRPLSLFAIEYVSDSQFIYSTKENEYFSYNIYSKKTKKLFSLPKDALFVEIEPSSKNVAFKENDNIFALVNGKKTQLSFDGTKFLVYGETVHRNEFGIDKGLFWSKNGERLAFYRMDQSMVTDYPLVNTSERVAQLNNVKYPMAGMASHWVTVGVFDTKTSNIVYLKTRKDETIEEKEMYLTNIAFSPNGKIVYIKKLNRLQNHYWLEKYDAISGEKLGVLFEETSKKYVEPQTPIIFLPNNPKEFLDLSQKDGYNHIYLYDTLGRELKQLTKGEWMVNSIAGFNSKGDEVFFYATKDSPIERNLYGVKIKNGEIKKYSSDNGWHNVAFNSKGDLFLDTYSNYDKVYSKTQLLDKKGKVLKIINESEDPLKDILKPQIEISTLKTKDGTELYYRMIKPHDFNPNKKYPVIVYVYGGPHAQLVTNNYLGGANNFFMFLAQKGYIVWTIDSRGSANRGYDFESAIWHSCGSVEVSDQMEGVNYLKTLPYIDSTRIGVDGWSYGGFMTISLKLKNPKVFKVATAGGPVIDWKWYEVMYGERYMGTPQNNEEGYKTSSLLNYVQNLEGKLLVIHGYQDATVVPQHSIEFIKACIKHGKQVDFFLYPDHEHNVMGKDRLNLYEKIYQYYKENL
ncbi:MAG: DPP IV N-terminal domain-containing protein [Bacteroidales bacterium]|jgi:dipeptidyl-peptidase-4|nr:DPP IV N-terminal domain-containing protein [Bacteroidales bacterium]